MRVTEITGLVRALTYRVTDSATLIGCELSREARGNEGPVAVQLEDVYVVCGAVCGAVAYQIALRTCC